MKLEKRLDDSHGEVIVRVMSDLEGRLKQEGMPIAEIVTQGCVVGFYVLRLVDNIQWIAEFNEVHDRLTSVKMDDTTLQDALYWGREIADTVINFFVSDSTPPVESEKTE